MQPWINNKQNIQYMSIKKFIPFALTVAVIGLGGCGDNNSTTTSSSSDSSTVNTPATAPQTAPAADPAANQNFVNEASAMNLAEINAHKAAEAHAVNSDVKMHARHMLTDHQKLGDDMKALADKKGWTVATEPLTDKKQTLDDMNANKKGKDWDAAYVDQQIADHQEAISKFEAAQNTVTDPDLKNLITQALPTLRDHLKMVQDLKANMK